MRTAPVLRVSGAIHHGDLLRAVAAYRVFVTPQLVELDRESLVMTAAYPRRY